MEFLVKVKAPNNLRQKDILEEMRFGIRSAISTAQKQEDGEWGEYVDAFRKIKIQIYRLPKQVKKLQRIPR